MLKRWQIVIIGFCEILDGSASVLSLGSYHPKLAFIMTAKFELMNLTKYQRKE